MSDDQIRALLRDHCAIDPDPAWKRSKLLKQLFSAAADLQ